MKRWQEILKILVNNVPQFILCDKNKRSRTMHWVMGYTISCCAPVVCCTFFFLQMQYCRSAEWNNILFIVCMHIYLTISALILGKIFRSLQTPPPSPSITGPRTTFLVQPCSYIILNQCNGISGAKYTVSEKREKERERLTSDQSCGGISMCPNEQFQYPPMSCWNEN